jgi:hypothetical protein
LFPHPGGEIDPKVFKMPLGWRYSGSQPEITDEKSLKHAEYLGFDAEGSWFVLDGIPYIWNSKTKSLVEPLHAPTGQLMLPGP